MKKALSLLCLCVFALSVSGCGHQIKDINRSWNRMWNGEDCAAQKEYDTPSAPAPAGSKFAQIQLGMDYQQVWSIMGMPSSFGQTIIYVNIAHKSAIDSGIIHPGPRYVQFDFYKGIGTVIYASSSPDIRLSPTKEVVKVTYNPNESGFRPVIFYDEGFKHNDILLGPAR